MSISLTNTNFEHLLSELRRITTKVALRVEEMRATIGNDEDEFRGLYVSEDEVNQLLADPDLFQGNSGLLTNPEIGIGGPAPVSRLTRLQTVFGLSAFERDVVLIALAPEIELRFEKLYSYLQDDVTRRRPSIDMTLRLLCPGLAAQVAARRSFDAEGALLKYRLIEFTDDNQNRQASLLSRSIKLDEGIVSYLLGEDRLDARLRHIATIEQDYEQWLTVGDNEDETDRLVELAQEGYITFLLGQDESSKFHLAAEVCRRLGIEVVKVEAAVLPGLAKAESLLRLLERECILRGAALYLNGFDNLLKEEAPIQEALRQANQLLQGLTGITFVASEQALSPMQGHLGRREFYLQLNMPGYSERQRIWEKHLGLEAIGLDLEGLSSRFKLSRGQIVAAAATARNTAAWRGETAPTLADLEAACRRHSTTRLSNLARKIKPLFRWDDIVLPPDPAQMLKEIVQQVRNRSLVYEKWGFDTKLSYGKGLNVIFAGPSGTGKTMSAEIIAGELKMDLYKIDLSNMVSKYIGETEKNLERIFNEAGESNAILFFDEADSIFGKRSEVKDAHDRYANIETGYLLQKMEEYDGIVILATNLRKNLDDAFIRRMHFMIEYPFPEEEDRYQIWQRSFPKGVPMGATVDIRFMARQFKIAGGNIKNICLTASFLAAGDLEANPNQAVEMVHLIKATRREFQKMGKLCTASDFGRYYGLISEY
jgi:SpoVK/Ycf46/Vps4 family AAA+-type ATPase